jgi:iron complex outermembrane receptor protein
MYFYNNASTVTPHTRIPGYGLLNLRYDWANILSSNFSAAVYAKNVMGKEYYTGGFSLSASLGVSSVSVGTPRMVGGELTYNF